MSMRILLVGSCHVVRQGLCVFLQKDPEIEIVGEAADSREALQKARQMQPELVLVDLLFPTTGSIAFIKALHRELPDTKVLIFVSMLKNDLVAEALHSGASDYLLKDIGEQELQDAIKETLAGLVRLSSQIRTSSVKQRPMPTESYNLTVREYDVLRLLVEGCSNQAIACTLHVTEPTVKTHVHHILTKLRVQSRTQAVLAAVRLGLVPQARKL
jgi:two-component system, NarL family, response regulator LiaR